jgi:malate dehydrogenase
VLVISNPVNSTVPIVVEVFKQHGVFDPKRSAWEDSLFAELVALSIHKQDLRCHDSRRRPRFYLRRRGLGDLSKAPSVTVPVVGGHSGVTVRELLSSLSQRKPIFAPKALLLLPY